MNGDGFDDLIVGAMYGDNGGIEVGQAYVIQGSRPTEAVERSGTAIGQAIFGGNLNDAPGGGAGADILDGGTGANGLMGGAGNDTCAVNSTGDLVFEATTTASTLGAGGIDTVCSSVPSISMKAPGCVLSSG